LVRKEEERVWWREAGSNCRPWGYESNISPKGYITLQLTTNNFNDSMPLLMELVVAIWHQFTHRNTVQPSTLAELYRPGQE
jgi:hypothetical protein